MPNWREITEADLAASISQREIDTYRRDGASQDGSDPVERLLASTVALVRGYCAMNGAVRLGPAATIPASLVIPAMDYAMAKLLNRIAVALNEDRRSALRRAEDIFDAIAKGAVTPESYSEDDSPDEASRPASAPAFAPATPARLLD